MTIQPITIEDFRAFIHKGEASDPIVFLESIVTGQDPRRISKIYDLIMDIDEFSDVGFIFNIDCHDQI